MKSILVIATVLVFSSLTIPSFAQELPFEDQFVNSLENLRSLVTIIAGLATAGALIFVGYETMMSRNERKNILRAWVGVGEPRFVVDGYFNKDKEFVRREKWSELSIEERDVFKFIKIRRSLEIKNYGQLPATRLKARTKFLVGTPPKKEILESKEYGSLATIMPNGTVKLFFTISKDEELSIQNPEENCYFVWELEYESPKGKQRRYGEITSLMTNRYGNVDSWDENS